MKNYAQCFHGVARKSGVGKARINQFVMRAECVSGAKHCA
jgi:hypothetical protein